jgi:hypothetical protein
MPSANSISPSWRPLQNASLGWKLSVAALGIGACHYLVAVTIWLKWLRGFGVDGDNYLYWLRDALPALLFCACYVVSVACSLYHPRFAKWSASLLVILTVAHFFVDNIMHHFTLQMMTQDRGCVWISPTWWWYEHQCAGWWHP